MNKKNVKDFLVVEVDDVMLKIGISVSPWASPYHRNNSLMWNDLLP